MCGISAYISNKKYISKADFIKLTNTLHHRGPDADGFYENSNHSVLLGHKRLSIIDLSPESNQPFFSKCGRYTIVYNGELYNFKNLKTLLQLDTHTQGDTEVILEAYAKIGSKAFELLNGMFAFIIYDILEDKIIVCRDRMGIKPLYIYQDSERIAFASEIKAFKALPEFDNTINYNTIPEFLHLGFIAEPNTIFKKIAKFPTGSYSIFSTKEISNDFKPTFNKYWKINESILPETYKDFTATKKKLKELLLESVEMQLVSDVPVGSFLSGGIDSSLITALAASIKKDKIKTFSIGYDNKKYDESEYAKNISKHLSTDHYVFKLNEENVEGMLSDIITTYDEPFADASAYPTMMVSNLAKEQVTVTLSGDGADELFFGYGMYTWATRLNNPMVQMLREPVYWATQFGTQRLKRGGLLLDYPSKAHIKSHIFSQEQYFHSEKDLKHILLDEQFNFDTINKELKETKRILNAKREQYIWDINYYLKDDLLVKVDRASMKYSLENRVPYLDNKVIDYVLNIDQNLLFNNGVSKYILKEILYDYLPKEYFNRPKWGFAIPLPFWLKGKFRFLLDKYMNNIIINKHDILTNLYVQDIKNRFLAGEDYLYGRVWTIIILHWWLEENT